RGRARLLQAYGRLHRFRTGDFSGNAEKSFALRAIRLADEEGLLTGSCPVVKFGRQSSRLDLSSALVLPIMPATYVRRFRMEIDLRNLRLPQAALPDGFRWLAWHPTLLVRHSRVKFLSFRDERDSL